MQIVPPERRRFASGIGVALERAASRADRTGGRDLARTIGAVARGDLTGFDELYDDLAPVVYGMVRGVLRDPLQSEEVTQEVLLEIWRMAPRYDPAKGSVMAWTATIAHRRAVDRVRSEQRAAERALRVADSSLPEDDVVSTVEMRLDHERVRRCMDNLTDLQRESLTLAYYRGLTYREVAELLGVALGTVNTRMRDGLVRLRDCMGVER
jgi:RNA polymerase sigma-70 factor (ECF subfamily)